MKIHLDTPTEEVQIQIIPLIDVIFCILTFFILAALQLTRSQGIETDVPRASTGSTLMRDMIVVTVKPGGLTYLDRDLQPVDRAQLLQRLQAYHQQKPDGLLVLNGSQTAFYNDVVQVLDVMRSVSDRVALATSSADASPTPGTSPAPNSPSSPSLTPAPLSTPFAPTQLPSPSTAPTGGAGSAGELGNPSGASPTEGASNPSAPSRTP